jgi:hypothetical protein
LVLAASSGCNEEPVTRYATVADAKNGGLFERGWVPAVLPDDAGPLTEAHNLDTNASCALAKFSPARFDQVLSALTRERFQRHDSAIPSPPLGGCPFDLSDFKSASTVLSRVSTSGVDEFAALSESGTFMFMSAR